jgi:hypothetical protein
MTSDPYGPSPLQAHYDKAAETIGFLVENGFITEEQHEKAVDRLDRVFMRDDCTPESLANIAAYYSSLYA